MQVKLISTWKVVHLVSFWKSGFLKLGGGLLGYSLKCTLFVNLALDLSVSQLTQEGATISNI